MTQNEDDRVALELAGMSRPLNKDRESVGVILAAGHGKRIKSETSKMLHRIWGVPTVTRVADAVTSGLGCENLVIVVGVKALEVAAAVDGRPGTLFSHQARQRGTGHAVRCALGSIGDWGNLKTILIAPGDVGLLTAETVRDLKENRDLHNWDLGVLTGHYDGPPESNVYGRIVRAPAGTPAEGNVLGIVEFRDIQAMGPEDRVEYLHRGHRYAFSREDLFPVTEFNTGVMIGRLNLVRKYLERIGDDNAQGEIYLTDLIELFVEAGLTVGALPAEDNNVSLGFNDKRMLRKMEGIARERVYNRIGDLITILDDRDFYIADDVVARIVEMDAQGGALDIVVGEGAHIGAGVRLNHGVVIGRDARLDGNVELGPNVEIQDGALLSTYPDQRMTIGEGTVIMQGDLIKGPVTVGRDVRIESGVNVTGSDEFPVIIGDRVVIKGTSYIFGCHIEDDVSILHSVLLCKRVRRRVREDGKVQPIRYILPYPQGVDSIEDRIEPRG